MDIKEKIANVNLQIDKIESYINEHDAMFDYMDLKLHDVSWYCYTDFEKDFPLTYANATNNCNEFYWFCEDSYAYMIENFEEHNIDVADYFNYIGRTSKFYLKHNVDYSTYKRYGIHDIICEIIEYYSWYNLTSDLNDNGRFEINEYTDVEELNSMLDDVINNNLYNYFMDDIEDVIEIYNYIKDFKDNQVEIFKENMACREDDFKYEIEQEKQTIENNINIVHAIQLKYGMSTDDVKVLINSGIKAEIK